MYKTFTEWKNGNWLEDGEPRKEAYTRDELLLVEMGWKYGFDAGKAQQADRIAELEKQGEPVAWIRSGDDQLSLVKEKDDGYMVWKPLYLAPQTKPLSDGVILNSIQHPRNDGYVPEELNSDSLEMVEIDLPCVLTIDEIHNLFGITALNPTVTLTWEQCEKIARAIEERHGIK